jgi:arsenate reductase
VTNSKHVLFLCVANSARSQMAEGLARSLLPSHVRVSSAGSEPGRLNPLAVRALGELGLDISAHYSKSVNDIDHNSIDIVITLCAEEVCPVFPRPVEKIHWGLPDPASAAGSDAEKLAKFREVRDELEKRLKEFSARFG